MTDTVSQLRGERPVAGRGDLTLDREKAKEKLRLFRLPDPHFYVLQFVRAATVLGASRIDFQIGPTEATCRFDAELLGEHVENLWDVALAARTNPAEQGAHYMALGISSAQALNPHHISLTSSGRELVLTNDSEQIAEVERGLPRTQIRLVEKFRFGHLKEFFESFIGQLPEEKALVDHAIDARLVLTVNGNRIRRPPFPPDLAPTGASAGTHVHIEQSNTLEFVLLRDGVRVWQRAESAQQLGGRIVMDSRDVQLDLSGMAVAELPPDLTKALYGSWDRALKPYLQQLGDSRSSPWYVELFTENARRIAQVGPPIDEGSRELIDWCVEQPWFLTVRGAEPRSLAMARNAAGAVEFSRAPVYLDDSPFNHVLRAPRPDLFAALRPLGVACEDVTEAVSVAHSLQMNRARWAERPRVTIAAEVVHDHMRAAAHPASEGRVDFYLGGRLLRSNALNLPLRIDIDGDFETTPAFDDILRDAAFEAFAQKVLAHARDVCRRTDVSWVAIRLAVALLSNRFDQQVLEALGFSTVEARSLTIASMADLPLSGADIVEALGELADVVTCEREQGSPVSLREIALSENSPVFGPLENLPLLTPSKRYVLKVEGELRELIKLLYPDADKAHVVIEREVARERFFHSAPYVRRPREHLFTHQAESGDVRVNLFLLSYEHRTTEARLIWKERVIARHIWAAPAGQWGAEVWSDAFEPEDSYADVRRDQALHDAQQLCREAMSEACMLWYDGVCKDRSLPVGSVDLFWQITLSRPPDKRRFLPVHRSIGATWEADLVSADDLAATAAETGRIDYTTRPFPAHAMPVGTLRLALPSRVPVAALQVGPLAEIILRNADGYEHIPNRPVTGSPATPPVPPPPPAPLLPSAPPPSDHVPESLLDAVRHRLLVARAGERRLIDDHILEHFVWRDDDGPWLATAENISLGRSNKLADVAWIDPIGVAFLASAAATAVNAYYRSISDTDELELQHKLLRGTLE